MGAGHGVVFNQPTAQSATLNRVTGAASSTIAGSITANGAVYLVNPNGIAITPSGTVQTGGGFVASTLDIADADFNAGKLAFAGSGASKAVSNAGSITAGQGAYVALLGGSVSNSGTISVPLGRVGLGSGEAIALDLNGDGFMQVAVTSSLVGAGIDMPGSIAAAGGRVELKAAGVVDAVRRIVNVPGSISADSAVGDGGSIVLLAEGGSLTASGTLTARATGATGNGGMVETSGAKVDFTGVKVDTSAANGTTGTWLVDPTDVTIDAAAAATISTSLASSNVTIQTTSGSPTITGTTATGVQTSGNGDITVASAINWSSTHQLTLNAYNNIALNAAVTGASGGLNLTAANAISQTNVGAITAAYLIGSAGAGIGLGTAANHIGTLSSISSTGGAFALNNGSTQIYVGSAINATGQTVSLATTAANGVVEGGSGSIAAGTLVVSSGGPISLTSTANAIATLGSVVNTGTGAVTIVDGQALSVAGSILNNGGDVSLQTSGALTWTPTSTSIGGLLTLNGASGVTLNTGLTAGTGISLTGVTTLGADLTLTPGTGTATFNSMVGGQHALTVNGAASFSDTVGLTTAGPLTSLTITGAALLNGGPISTTGAQSYADATATFGALASLSAGSTISFSGAIVDNNNLSLYATGITLGTSVSGSSVLTLAAGSGTITAANTTVNIGTFALASGTWSQTGTLPTFKATAFNLNPVATFLRVTGGDGSSATPYIIADAYGLQGIASSSLLAKNFTLTNNIDLSGTAAWNTGAGWVAIGTNGQGSVWDGTSSFTSTTTTGTTGFTGTLAGGGYTLNGLTISRLTANQGLVGYASGSASLRNLALTGVAITSGGYVGALLGRAGASSTVAISNASAAGTVTGTASGTGGLVGLLQAGSINNASAAVTVKGTSSVGGLVGSAYGSVTNSSASGTVTASSTSAGGLIGDITTTSTVTGSSATGNVTGTGTSTYVGGLVGYQSGGTISNSYAMTGTVQGPSYVGGLVGYQYVGSGVAAKITNSYATGNVAATAITTSYVGGLVGRMALATNATGAAASIDTSYATGTVTAPAGGGYAGGLVGGAQGFNATALAAISNSYATGKVATAAAGALNYAGGLVGSATYMTLTDVHATGAVGPTSSTSNYAGGLVGYVTGGSVTGTSAGSVYATGDVSGGNYVGGLIGDMLTSATVTNARASGAVTAPPMSAA